MRSLSKTAKDILIAWYVDIYEANLYFANAIMWKHLNKYSEPITSLWKWEINNFKKENESKKL